jgi:single-strand DNA-binding protein
MSINNCVIGGNLTKAPELKYTKNGTARVRLNIAVNRKYKDGSGQLIDDTQFIPIVVWGTQAENCDKYLVKGQEATVIGRLSIDKFDGEDGAKITFAYLTAQQVQFGRKPASSGNGQPTEKKEPVPTDEELSPF